MLALDEQIFYLMKEGYIWPCKLKWFLDWGRKIFGRCWPLEIFLLLKSSSLMGRGNQIQWRLDLVANYQKVKSLLKLDERENITSSPGQIWSFNVFSSSAKWGHKKRYCVTLKIDFRLIIQASTKKWVGQCIVPHWDML